MDFTRLEIWGYGEQQIKGDYFLNVDYVREYLKSKFQEDVIIFPQVDNEEQDEEGWTLLNSKIVKWIRYDPSPVTSLINVLKSKKVYGGKIYCSEAGYTRLKHRFFQRVKFQILERIKIKEVRFLLFWYLT